MSNFRGVKEVTFKPIDTPIQPRWYRNMTAGARYLILELRRANILIADNNGDEMTVSQRHFEPASLM